jgi:hypothetical protein
MLDVSSIRVRPEHRRRNSQDQQREQNSVLRVGNSSPFTYPNGLYSTLLSDVSLDNGWAPDSANPSVSIEPFGWTATRLEPTNTICSKTRHVVG